MRFSLAVESGAPECIHARFFFLALIGSSDSFKQQQSICSCIEVLQAIGFLVELLVLVKVLTVSVHWVAVSGTLKGVHCVANTQV